MWWTFFADSELNAAELPHFLPQPTLAAAAAAVAADLTLLFRPPKWMGGWKDHARSAAGLDDQVPNFLQPILPLEVG